MLTRGPPVFGDNPSVAEDAALTSMCNSKLESEDLAVRSSFPEGVDVGPFTAHESTVVSRIEEPPGGMRIMRWGPRGDRIFRRVRRSVIAESRVELKERGEVERGEVERGEMKEQQVRGKVKGDTSARRTANHIVSSSASMPSRRVNKRYDMMSTWMVASVVRRGGARNRKNGFDRYLPF